MGRRNLLSADERVRLFDIPVGRDALARCYSFEPGDLALIERRREDRNRLGFAVQLALVRQPGLTLGQILAQPGIDLTPFVDFIAEQLKLPASEFDGYAAREQTMTDHAGDVAKALGLRSATRADLVLMIDAAAIAAWATRPGRGDRHGGRRRAARGCDPPAVPVHDRARRHRRAREGPQAKL